MAHRAAFRAVDRLVGASECAVIRAESSQGHRYSFKGNANTAESDNCLSAGALRGSATVCTQSTKLPAVVNVRFRKKWKNAKLPCQVFRLLEFSTFLWREMEMRMQKRYRWGLSNRILLQYLKIYCDVYAVICQVLDSRLKDFYFKIPENSYFFRGKKYGSRQATAFKIHKY